MRNLSNTFSTIFAILRRNGRGADSAIIEILRRHESMARLGTTETVIGHPARLH